MKAQDIVIRPIITEKSMAGNAEKKYTFEVCKDANKIEIAKAVLINAKMIIMDEPTSSLVEKEVEQLMKTCRDLKARGIGIVFVSHKLEELFELFDRV